MTMDTQTLLREAIAAVKAGDKARGRALLARVLQVDPRNEQAWMWMSEVVETDERRAYCLRRVLAINPENESAKKGLQSLTWEPIQRAERRKPNRMPLIIFIAALVVSIPCCVLLIGFVTRSPSDTSKPLPGSNVGYLWWENDRTVWVLVVGEVHQNTPASGEQAKLWTLRGEACLVEPGTKAWRDSGEHPFATIFIEVAEGSCQGFRGWVPWEAWQASPP
jgi:hypothetical protein